MSAFFGVGATEAAQVPHGEDRCRSVAEAEGLPAKRVGRPMRHRPAGGAPALPAAGGAFDTYRRCEMRREELADTAKCDALAPRRMVHGLRASPRGLWASPR